MRTLLDYENKYFGFDITFPLSLEAVKNCWDLQFPKYKNWFRFMFCTPFFSFYITGWLFWGKKG